jgi:hypothetical protein
MKRLRISARCQRGAIESVPLVDRQPQCSGLSNDRIGRQLVLPPSDREILRALATVPFVPTRVLSEVLARTQPGFGRRSERHDGNVEDNGGPARR